MLHLCDDVICSMLPGDSGFLVCFAVNHKVDVFIHVFNVIPYALQAPRYEEQRRKNIDALRLLLHIRATSHNI